MLGKQQGIPPSTLSGLLMHTSVFCRLSAAMAKTSKRLLRLRTSNKITIRLPQMQAGTASERQQLETDHSVASPEYLFSGAAEFVLQSVCANLLQAVNGVQADGDRSPNASFLLFHRGPQAELRT